MQSGDLVLPSSQNDFVKHLSDSSSRILEEVTAYKEPDLRKSLPTSALWLLTAVRKGTYINSRRRRTQGSTAPLGQEGCYSTPPPSLANFASCEGHCLLPSGFGWKADDFIARFDNKEMQCCHWTSRFCHSVLLPKERVCHFFGSKLREYYSENGTIKTIMSVKSKAALRLFLMRSESLSQEKCYIFSSKWEQNICRERALGHTYL